MTNRPILFSAPMIQAILREISSPGTGKTQTRRVLKPQPTTYQGQREEFTKIGTVGYPTEIFAKKLSNGSFGEIVKFAPGDRLWVRETWTTGAHLDQVRPRDISPEQSIGYVANENEGPWLGKLRPSIYMPRWASRITLDVTDVRVQRLQEISAADARAEGHEVRPDISSDQQVHDDAARDWFMDLWDSLNADRGFGWGDNPWVVAVTFRPHLRNIDQMEKAA